MMMMMVVVVVVVMVMVMVMVRLLSLLHVSLRLQSLLTIVPGLGRNLKLGRCKGQNLQTFCRATHL